MLLAISEQTENLLYILGGFVVGVVITLISSLISNWQISHIEKNKFKYKDCFELMIDIQKLLTDETDTYMFSTLKNIVHNRNTSLKAFHKLQAYYEHYKIYFSSNKKFEDIALKLYDIDEKLSEKIKEYDKQNDQSILDYMNNELIKQYRNSFFKCAQILNENLSLYLHEYLKEKPYCNKFK